MGTIYYLSERNGASDLSHSFPRKVELLTIQVDNRHWQANFTFLTINLNFWVTGENANMEYPPTSCLEQFKPYLRSKDPGT